MGNKQNDTRDFILAGNWKMHKTPNEAAGFFSEFALGIAKAGPSTSGKRLVFFVPSLVLDRSLQAVEKRAAGPALEVGCQNAFWEPKGAFTGETSAVTVASMGAKWLLVGHSERRSLFGESDQDTAKKVKAGLEAGLNVMLCVGETLSERESNRTLTTVERQLSIGLSTIENKDALLKRRVAIAYEPVWAIGTGKVATPEQASEVHVFIRSQLERSFGKDAACAMSILYGGSVKPDNAASIASKPGIDGFLVGGASLEVPSMLALASV